MGDGGGCILLFSRQPPLVTGLLRRGPLPLLNRTPTALTPTSSTATATATATGVPAPELGNLLSHPPAAHSNGQGEPLWPPLGVIDMELCPSSSSSPSQLLQQQPPQLQLQPQKKQPPAAAAATTAASTTTSTEAVHCLLEDGKKEEEQGKKEHADCTRQLLEQLQPSSPIHRPHEGNIKLQSNTTRAEEKASGNEIMLQGDGQDGCTTTSHNEVDTVRSVSEDGMLLRRNDTSSSHRVAVKFSDAASSHSHANSADNCREKCEHILDEGCNGTSANLHFSHKRNGSGSGSDSPAGKSIVSSDRRSSYGGSAPYNSNNRLREESEGERSRSQRGSAESHLSSRRSSQYAGEKRSYPQRDIEHYRLEELSNNRDGDLQREERLHRKESGYHQREERSSSRVRSCHRETDHQYDEQKESEGSHPREFNHSHEEKSQQREMDRQHEDRSQEKELKMESGYQKEKSYQRESSRQRERSFQREGDNQRDRLHRESNSQRERYQRDGDGRRERSQQRESDSKRESSYSHGDRSHRKEADYRAEDSSHLKGYKERSQQREKSRQRENDHEHDDRLRQRERLHRKEGLHQHEEQSYPGARPRQRESDHQQEERSHRRENDCQLDERTQRREGNYRHEGKLHQRERSTRQESDHLSMERPQWTDSDLPSEERLHRRDSDSHPEERIRRRESDYLYRGRSHQHGERLQWRESDNQPDEKSNQRDSGSQYRERSNQRDSDHRHERDLHSIDTDNQHEQMPHQKVGTYRREEKLHQRESGHRYEERSHHRESSSQHEEKAQQRERSHPRDSNYGHEERLHQREGDHPCEERSTRRESNHQYEERPNRREGDRQYEEKATPREGDHQYEDRSTWREGNHQYEEKSTQKEGGHQYEERSTLKEGDHQHEERSRRRETDYQHIERSQKRENDHFYEDRSHWRESHHEYPSRSRWRENDHHYEERSHGKEGEQYEDRSRWRDHHEDRLGWKDSDNCREERPHQESNLPHEERQHGRESDHCSSREQVDHHSHPRDKQQCKDKEDADDSRVNDLHAPAVVESLTCDGGYADDSRYEMMEIEMEISPEPSVEHHAPHSSFEVTWNDANYADNSFMCRGWVYINSKGCTRGPMNLSELKQLMVNGELQPDHLVKLSNSNSWVTLENARSPVPEDPLTFIPTTFPGQLQAPLSWNDPYHQQFLPACGKSIGCIEQVNCVKPDAYERDVVNVCSYGSGIEQSFVEPEELPDLRIDERVDELMKGFALTPGHEKEVISEALNRAARSVLEDDEMDSGNEESPRSHTGLAAHWKENQLLEGEQALEGLGSNIVEVAAPKENLLETDALCVNSFQSTRKWTARGGDWKLTYQFDVATGGKVQVNAASFDRSLKTKIVLNGGIPLCEGRLSGLQDPRRELQDSSNTQGFKRRRLEIPPWGFHWFHSQVPKIEEQWMQNGQPPANATPNRPLAMQISQISTPGAHMLTPKGTTAASGGFRDALKMNRSGKEVGAGSTLSGIVGHMGLAPLACEPTPAGFQNGFLNVSSQDCLHETVDGSRAKPTREYESFHISENPSSSAYVEFSQPFRGKPNVEGFAEQLQREKDLNLHKGDWYYREGTGQEIGPNPYSELQLMLKHGLLGNGITIYRRSDDIWIPLSLRSVSLSSAEREGQNCPSIALQESRSSQHLSEEETNSEEKDELLNFHQTYPQFMGYMCGMLHDHVMKSFRIGPFAATLTEGLDKWHGDKQRESLGGVVQALAGTMNVSSQATGTSSRNVADGSFDVDDKVFKISSRDIEAQPSLSAEATDNADKKRCLDSGDSALFKQQAIQSMDSSDTKCNVLKEEKCVSEMQIESSDEHSKSSIEFEAWGSLDCRVLATIFFNFKGDSRSLIRASAVCKSWRLAFEKFRQEAKDMDFSSLGNILIDIVLESSHLRNKRGKNPSTQTIDISSFEQPKDSSQEFPEKKRIGPSSMPKESHRNFKSLKQINMKSAAISNDNCADEISEPMELDSLDDASQTVNSHNFLKCLKSEKADSGSDNYSHKGLRRDHAGTELREKVQMPPTSEQKQKRDGPMQAFKMNHHISSSEKISSPKVKKESSWRAKVSERDKSIERMLAEVLRKVKAADTQKIFSHQVPDAKGTISRPLDFAAIENKLKGGEYPRGKDGVLSFKDDLFLLCRSAFHGCRKGNPVFNAAEQVFKLAYRLVSEVEKTYDPKRLYNGTLIKASQGKSNKNSSISQIGGKRREFSEEPLKYRGTKRRRDADSGSLDDDSEENSSEKDGRRVPSHLRKKKQQREWGMDSSGSDEEDDNNFYEEDESDDGHEIGSISESDGEDAHYENGNSLESEAYYQEWFDRTWGARMTKAAMVPPVTRKYDVIDKYMVVADNVEVEKKMKVNLPEEYEKKLQAAKENRGAEYSHLEIPELKDYSPRKRLGDEVIEQEVYGIDPYTYNLLLDSMPPERDDFSESKRQQLIEEDLLRALNKGAMPFTSTGKTPMKFPLEQVVERLIDETRDFSTKTFYQALLKAMENRPKDKYVAYRKGLGVVCNKKDGFQKDDFVVEFFGEVYPAWRWYEKQDAIRSLQKNDKDPAPEFYNIFLERPKGDASGYDLVVVDAMHKANYASRICHSCRPNCEAKVTAVNGCYQIGVYTLRPVHFGEELTFDYNSVTESKEEHEASVCLCGNQVCRGSYLHLAGSGTFQEVMKRSHGLLDRHHLLLEACTSASITESDWDILNKAGLGSSLLEGLPDWAICYIAGLVRFINQERKDLPKEIMKIYAEDRRLETWGEIETFDAEVQADGVYNQRLQNLAITLDKVRYILKQFYSDLKAAPPPLRKLRPEEIVSLIWKGEHSVVMELLQAMEVHCSKDYFEEFQRKIHEHDPLESGNIEENLRKSLLWLRDELCKVPVSCSGQHDAAADILHMYAYTKVFFTSQDYNVVESPPLTINSLDLGPKYAHLLGSSSYEWRKSYSKDYILGQLLFWYTHNSADPGSTLAKAQCGCLVLPDISSCFAKSHIQDRRLMYSRRHRAELLEHLEKKPQKKWPRSEFWEFKNCGGILGSRVMDSRIGSGVIDGDMMDWLKNRASVAAFESPLDD